MISTCPHCRGPLDADKDHGSGFCVEGKVPMLLRGLSANRKRPVKPSSIATLGEVAHVSGARR